VSGHKYSARSVRRLPIEGGLLLLDSSSNSLSIYNESALQVWEFLEQGRSLDELAPDFAASFGISEDLARRDVEAILHQWQSQGLIQVDGQKGPPVSKPYADVKADWTQIPAPRWAATLTCTIRNVIIQFSIEPHNWTDFLQIFFKHLETPGAEPDVRIGLRETAVGEIALLVDDIERLRTADGGELISAVNQIILEHIHSGVEWFAIIHGAAVARNGNALAFPAACGSGKTTLAAYLLTRGFTYLADDQIALSAPDGLILPWPMPLSIKPGSWDVLLEAYEDLPSFPHYRTKRGSARQLVPPSQVWDTEPVPVQALVFPQYGPGENVKLTRLTSFQALARLLGDKTWLGYPITERRVQAFYAWLDKRPTYMLVHGDVAEAARCIESIA